MKLEKQLESCFFNLTKYLGLFNNIFNFKNFILKSDGLDVKRMSLCDNKEIWNGCFFFEAQCGEILSSKISCLLILITKQVDARVFLTIQILDITLNKNALTLKNTQLPP